MIADGDFKDTTTRYEGIKEEYDRIATQIEALVRQMEQAASEFLWEKYLSNDPLKMYVAFRIWNSYLLAREPLSLIHISSIFPAGANSSVIDSSF